MTLPLIIATIIGPNIAKIYYEKKIEVLKKKLKKNIFFSFFLALGITILFLFFGKYLIYFLFPNYYDEKMISLIILYSFLLFSYIFVSILPSGFSVYTGHARLNTKFLLFFGFIHIILNYFLIRSFGFNGLIASILITRIPSDLLFIYFYRRIIFSLK